MPDTRTAIDGNWIVLAGALVYLLEWAAIVPAGETGPADAGSKTPEALVALYAHSPFQQAFLVTWLTIVLLGRIAIPVGIWAAVRQDKRAWPLAAVAAGAMAVSVLAEILAYAIVGAAAYLANQGAESSTIVTLDAVAGWMLLAIWAPLGASVLLGGLAMLTSRAFPAWITWLGVAAGSALVVAGVLGGPAYGNQGVLGTVHDFAQIGVPAFWIWMLSAGVYLARKAHRPRATPPAKPA